MKQFFILIVLAGLVACTGTPLATDDVQPTVEDQSIELRSTNVYERYDVKYNNWDANCTLGWSGDVYFNSIDSCSLSTPLQLIDNYSEVAGVEDDFAQAIADGVEDCYGICVNVEVGIIMVANTMGVQLCVTSEDHIPLFQIRLSTNEEPLPCHWWFGTPAGECTSETFSWGSGTSETCRTSAGG